MSLFCPYKSTDEETLKICIIIINATASFCGGWMTETYWSFHHWEPAPRWRLRQWLAKPDITQP